MIRGQDNLLRELIATRLATTDFEDAGLEADGTILEEILYVANKMPRAALVELVIEGNRKLLLTYATDYLRWVTETHTDCPQGALCPSHKLIDALIMMTVCHPQDPTRYTMGHLRDVAEFEICARRTRNMKAVLGDG